jgi:hypothetical protein
MESLEGDELTAWERHAPAAGIAAAILIVVASVLPGIPPAPDAPLEAIATHLGEHRGALLAQSLLFALAGPLVIWFYAALQGALAPLEGGRAPLSTAGFGALLLLLATGAVGSVGLTALVWRGPYGYGPDLVRFVWDAANLSLYSLSAPFSFASVAAPSLVAWRAGRLPDWLAAVTCVVALANAAELLGLFATRGPIAAGATAGVVAIPAFALWIAGASLALLRDERG